MAEQICDPLIREGIVELERTQDPTTSSAGPGPRRDDLRNNRRKKNRVLEASEDFTAWMMLTVSKYAFSERFHRGDTVVFPCQVPIYKLNARVRVEHSLCDLYRNYQTVRELAQIARVSARGGNDFRKLPFPPVFLDALKRAVRLDDVWRSVGDLWAAHTVLRARCRELRIILSDSDIAPAKREVEARKWRQEWSDLTKKWHDRVETFAAADTTEELCRVRGLLRLMVASPREGDKKRANPDVMEDLLECCNGFVKLREIHDSLEAYWNVSDRELYRQMERLLKRPITAKDHDDIVRTDEEDKREKGVVLVDFFAD